MKRSEILPDIETQKKNLLRELRCLNGSGVIKELHRDRIHITNPFTGQYILDEEYYIDSNPSYLFLRDIKGRKSFGVVVSAKNANGNERAKLLDFDVLDAKIDEYDQSLLRTGKHCDAMTSEFHDIFDFVSRCRTYLDVWNLIKGKRIKVSAVNTVNVARHNAANQVIGIRIYHVPVFTFVKERKTNDGEYLGPVKKCVVIQEVFEGEYEGKNIFTYHYDPNGFLQKVERYDDNGEITTQFYEYRKNDKGQVVEEIHPDGSLIKHYWGHNYIVKTIHLDKYGDVRKIIEYNNRGNITKETDLYKNSIDNELIYEYDRNMQLVKVENGTHNYRYHYNYLGQLIEKNEHQTWNKDKLCGITTYEYSSNGLLISTIEKGAYCGKTEYKYDESNRLIEELIYCDPEHNGKYVGRTRISYRHDAYGNCLFMQFADFDGKSISSKTVTEIKYY